MSFKVLNQLEQIDQQLESMDSEALLMVGNILSRNNIDLSQLVETLGEIATLSQPLQATVLEAIHAKVKAR